ncbi:MAG: chemotaxis protein CheE [Caulobacter sp.]|nr:chemotaxis protein CheE [Caulobacter sp.]
MSVNWVMRRSRLSKLVNQPGGVTVSKALAEAAVQTEEFRAEAMTVVAAALDELDAVVAAPPATEDLPAWLERVYFLATRISDTAGPFGYEDLCAAAFSLCELADRQRRGRALDLPPIRVHAGALRLLLAGDQPPAARKAVLAGLAQVVERTRNPVD